MKLLEIKNNLVKITYQTDENFALGDFLAIVDENSKSYVGQIINLKADISGNYAIAKLIFTFNNEGFVDNYDGTIPSANSEISFLDVTELLKLLPIEKPVNIGKLAQKNYYLKIDETVFENNLLICAEKFEDISALVKNLIHQLKKYSERVVITDTDYNFGEYEAIRFKRDFKLPLNYEMIDFIFENELTEVPATSKAVIQDIFHEVQEYTKTADGNFIPIKTFIDVVEQQYKQTDIPELALLKNKLLKYDSVFAQTKEEFENLKNMILENAVSYIDITESSPYLQREIITYVHKTLNEIDSYIYNFVKITNNNSNKKLLKDLLNNEHVFTNFICSHNYKYLSELKQHANNLILFAPQTVQHDFAAYNTLVNKLNPNEFIIYGDLTQNIPFLIELTDLTELSEQYETLPQETNTTEGDFEDFMEESVSDEPVSENNIENLLADDMQDDEKVDTTDEFPTYTGKIPEENFESNFETEDSSYELERAEFEENILKNDDVQKVLQETEISSQEYEDLPELNEVPQQENEVLHEQEVNLTKANELTTEENIINDEENNDLEDADLDFIETLTQDEPEIDDNNWADIIQEGSNVISDDETPEPDDLPVYPSENIKLTDESFEKGETVVHSKYGKGVIEKVITYGNKTLCSISFEQVGRRLLDPAISDLQKV